MPVGAEWQLAPASVRRQARAATKRARRWPLGSPRQTRVAANDGRCASPTMPPLRVVRFLASTEHRTARQSSRCISEPRTRAMFGARLSGSKWRGLHMASHAFPAVRKSHQQKSAKSANHFRLIFDLSEVVLGVRLQVRARKTAFRPRLDRELRHLPQRPEAARAGTCVPQHH